MPIPRPLHALTVIAALLAATHAMAGDVETYTDAAAASAQSALASDPAKAQQSSAQSSGFFRWFRSSEPKAPVEAQAPSRIDFPAVGLPAPIAAPLASSEAVANALGMLGVHYRRGGNTPDTGFDCSGLVRYVFQTALGLDLPRRAVEISKVGAKVDRDDLKPGDLVFYNTLKSAFSHVGIYLGDNRFIHAPSKGSQVRIEDMTQRYWTARFNGARRVTEQSGQ